MIQVQNMAVRVLTTDLLGTVATNNTSGTAVDTLGYRYATVISTTSKPTASNLSAGFSAFTVQKGPTSTGAWTSILAASTATTAEFQLPAEFNYSTSGQTIRADISLNGEKDRYLNVIVAPKITNVRSFCTLVILSREEQGPPSADAQAIAAAYFKA